MNLRRRNVHMSQPYRDQHLLEVRPSNSHPAIYILTTSISLNPNDSVSLPHDEKEPQESHVNVWLLILTQLGEGSLRPLR